MASLGHWGHNGHVSTHLGGACGAYNHPLECKLPIWGVLIILIWVLYSSLVGGYVGVGGLVSLGVVAVGGARHGMLLPKGGLTAPHGIAPLGLGLGPAYPGI